MTQPQRLIDLTRQWSEGAGVTTWFEEETSSTNDIAKTVPDFQLYLTAHQSSGRGRNENTWSDRSFGKNLIASWRFAIPSPPKHITGALFGLATYRSLSTTWQELKIRIKPPNDIYAGEKKIAGILMESISQGTDHSLVYGLGLNVFESPALGHAGCLADHLDEKRIESQWPHFLSTWQSELKLAVEKCQSLSLSTDDRRDLKNALHLKEIKEVDGNAALVYLDGRIQTEF